jgi:hypothetical protein
VAVCGKPEDGSAEATPKKGGWLNLWPARA